MFGIISAVAILLVTLIYAGCLCLHYRSSMFTILRLRTLGTKITIDKNRDFFSKIKIVSLLDVGNLREFSRPL